MRRVARLRPLTLRRVQPSVTHLSRVVGCPSRRLLSAEPATQHLQFQAETRQLLDIVAKSLYSEREVFLRELVSNAADALEKLRYKQLKGEEIDSPELEPRIQISLSDSLKSLTIEDSGIGMTREELISNLGTIARSGSKEFVKKADSGGDPATNIIGQFGVGFYSAFMVGSHVTVMTRSAVPGSPGLVWNSNGADGYELAEAVGIPRGTRIVIQLREDADEFCRKDRVREVLERHSNFVSYPVLLEGTQVNTVEPVWVRKSSEVTEEEHAELYQSLSGRKDNPLYAMQFSVDSPVSIKCVLYVPQFMPQIDISNMANFGISLYSRKVMVQPRNPKLLPEWLMFLQGVVDSEDVPLNLSREILQESVIVSKIKSVITGKMLAFLNRQSKRDPEKYDKFFREFGRFIRIGIITTESQTEREDLGRLLRFESSKEEAGVLVSLEQYLERAAADQKQIFYLSAPSREIALASPYYESLSDQGLEVLLTFNKEDDIALFRLESYKDKKLCSAENASVSPASKDTPRPEPLLTGAEGKELASWMRDALGRDNVKEVRVSERQHSQPAVVTVQNLTTLRRYLEMAPAEQKEASYKYLLHDNVTLELNPGHPIVSELNTLRTTQPQLAGLVAAQLFDNALINADLVHDPRKMVPRINQLIDSLLKSARSDGRDTNYTRSDGGETKAGESSTHGDSS